MIENVWIAIVWITIGLNTDFFDAQSGICTKLGACR
jgi:hypothetical protein